MPSLKDLNQVDWSRLNHAYGSAADIPEFLIGLKSKDEEERMDAVNQLLSTIWHQGTIYEATSYAVPFLIELLQDKSVSEKENILELLELIRTGKACDSDTGAEHERKAHAAVANGRVVYLKLVNKEDLHESCTKLLQAIEPETGDRDSLIAACQKESDDTKLASRIEALARQYPGDPVCLEFYKSLIYWRYSALLSSLTAVKVLTAQGDPGNYHGGLVDCLCKWSMEAEEPPGASSFTKIMKDIPDIAKDTAMRLIDDLLNRSDPTVTEVKSRLRPLLFFPVTYPSQAQDELGEMVLSRLLPILSNSQPIATKPIARVLLHFAFEDSKWFPEKELTQRQKRVLKEICANDQIWTEEKWIIWVGKKWIPVLEYFGLPAERAQLSKVCL